MQAEGLAIFGQVLLPWGAGQMNAVLFDAEWERLEQGKEKRRQKAATRSSVEGNNTFLLTFCWMDEIVVHSED